MSDSNLLKYTPQDIPTDRDIIDILDEQIKQLELKLNKDIVEDKYEIISLLNTYLAYPSNILAETHCNANKLGNLDLKHRKNQKDVRETMFRAQKKLCRCCGFYVQEEELSSCEFDFKDINNLGTSTVVYFKTISNIAILLLVMLVIYSIFSFATNLAVADSSTKDSMDYLSISLRSKFFKSTEDNDLGKIYYLVSSWLGVAMLVIWGILFVFMKKDIRLTEIIQKQSTNVSDYSIVIQKIPYGLKQSEVQEQLDQYYQRVRSRFENFGKLVVQKYNEGKPFYFNEEEYIDEQFKDIHKKAKQLKSQFLSWVKDRQEFQDFSTTPSHRNGKYEQFKQNQQRKNKKYEEIVEKIHKKLRQQPTESITTAFITFQTIQQRNFMLQLNSNDWFSKLKKLLPCIDQSNRFSIIHNNIQFKNLVIEPAPQPEDINWGNIGISSCSNFWRTFLTFFATIVMLGISFVIVYALSTVQNKNSNQRYISFLISLVISIINMMIIKVIQYTTYFERIYTMNNFQISLTIKSILAQLVNSIFIPIIVNYYIKDQNIYDKSGLTEDIFILSITMSFVPPIIKLVDPYYIYATLLRCYYQRPNNKINLNQYQLNRYFQKIQFQLGYEYIYLVSIFLFICFYVSLQPIIPVFAVFGLFFMYWIQKYCLFNRSQRPVPGTDVISFTIYQMLYLGPAAYALGSLTWSAFLPGDNFRNSLVANLIAAGIAFVILLFPYNYFAKGAQNEQPKKSYYQRRVYFPSEYDRLNPTTKDDGIHQYKLYLNKRKQEISGFSDQMRKQIQENFLHISQNNVYKGNNNANNIFGNEESLAINNLFYNECRNSVNPNYLKSLIFLSPSQDGGSQNFNKTSVEAQPHVFKRNQTEVNIGPQTMKNVKNPSSKYLDQNYPNQERSFRGPRKEDQMKNIYKSNLNFDDLGLESTINKASNRNYQAEPSSKRNFGI